MKILYDHTDIIERQNTQSAVLAEVLQHVRTIIQQEKKMATKFDDVTAGIQASIDEQNKDLTDLRSEIEEDKTAFEALAATNAAQSAMIKELLDAGGTPDQLAKLQALKASIDEQDAVRDAALARLKKARVDNTTAPTEPPSA